MISDSSEPVQSPLLDADLDALSEIELAALLTSLRGILWRRPSARRQLQGAGINITPSSFYSSVPSLHEIDNAFEYSQGPLKEWFNLGQFDLAAMVKRVSALDQYACEFDPPLEQEPENLRRYHWRNPAFSFSDATMYYCMLRKLQPEHVVEIGCGYSTLVADMALQRNGRGHLTLIEPYPKPFLRELKTVRSLIDQPVQSIPINDLVKIAESAEVLFIDSTHTVKVGSDCLTIYLQLLPQIRKNILVHAHDIYLPYGIPKAYAVEKHIYWTEQYLLYAYLLDNPKTRVMYSSQYMFRAAKDVLDRFMHGRYPSGGASIWFELDGSQGRGEQLEH